MPGPNEHAGRQEAIEHFMNKRLSQEEELIKRLEADCNSLNAITNRPDTIVLPCHASLMRTQYDIAEAIDILKGDEEMK